MREPEPQERSRSLVRETSVQKMEDAVRACACSPCQRQVHECASTAVVTLPCASKRSSIQAWLHARRHNEWTSIQAYDERASPGHVTHTTKCSYLEAQYVPKRYVDVDVYLSMRLHVRLFNCGAARSSSRLWRESDSPAVLILAADQLRKDLLPCICHSD